MLVMSWGGVMSDLGQTNLRNPWYSHVYTANVCLLCTSARPACAEESKDLNYPDRAEIKACVRVCVFTAAEQCQIDITST